MPSRFQIFPQLNLNIVVHSGFVTNAEAMASLGEYQSHPDASPFHMHLVDCLGVTDFERDYVMFMQTQMNVGVAFPEGLPEILLCLLSKDGAGRELASAINRTWEGSSYVNVRFAENHQQACEILGLNRVPDYALDQDH